MINRVPNWKLERYLLRELPPQEMADLERLLSEQAELRQRLRALEADSESISQRYPAAWMARQIQMRAAGAGVEASDTSVQISSWWRWSPALAIVLVAVIAIPLMRQPAPPLHSVAMEQVRIKGAADRLLLHRKVPEGNQRLTDGAQVNAGDLVMIQYEAAHAEYGLVFSIDGSGVVTRHLPLTGLQASALGQGVVSFEHAYALDEAPAWECFYFVTGQQPFDLEPVLAAAAAAARASDTAPQTLDLPPGLQQRQWTLLKSDNVLPDTGDGP